MSRIWMDSGAFSAFTLGSHIDLPTYTRWARTWGEFIDYYAVLDVIGSAEGTYENQKKMEALGAAPVPCFHYGEDVSWLKRYIAEGYEYIALGGMVPIETDALRHWLDELFEHYLCNDKGEPIVKVHGFGLTTMELVGRYPWFSVDSSSWLATSSFGSIMVWMDGNLHRICVSKESPKSGQYGAHVDTLPRALRSRLEHDLPLTYGVTLDEVRAHYRPRHVVNRMAYRQAETLAWAPRPYVPQQALFSTGPGPGKAPPAKGWPWAYCAIYLAGWVTYEVEAEMWGKEPRPRRMYSYHAMGKNQKMWATIMRHIEENRHND